MSTAIAHSSSKSGVSKNQILFLLFCCYVFFAPFEDLLEYLYGVKTIFKPYRIFGLLILIYGFFYQFRSKPFFVFKADFYATAYLLYGILYTVLLHTLGYSIDFGHMINSQLQVFFLFFIFLAFKRLNLTYKQGRLLFLIMCLGITINGLIIAIDFYFLHTSTREKGLSDNSNYAALGMVIAASYMLHLMMKRNIRLWDGKNMFYLLVIVALFLTILATGSRSGFLLVVIGFFLLSFALTNIRTKLRMVPLIFLTLVVVVFTPIFKDLTERVATFNRLQGATEDIRVPLAKAGIYAIRDTYGMGLGGSQILDRDKFSRYMEPVDYNLVLSIETRERGLGLHNMYVEVMVETGFIGLGLWLLYLFKVTRYQWRGYRAGGPNSDLHRLLFVCMILLLLVGVTAKCLHGALFWFLISFCSYPFLPDEKKSEAVAA